MNAQEGWKNPRKSWVSNFDFLGSAEPHEKKKKKTRKGRPIIKEMSGSEFRNGL